MILAADIGNSKIKFGLFDETGALKLHCALSSDVKRSRDEYAAMIKSVFTLYGFPSPKLEGAVTASVVPSLTGTVNSAIMLDFGLTAPDMITVGPGVRSGLKIKVENTTALGADIVAGAVAALALYQPPIVIIDVGTAMTVAQINGDGELCGVAIAAGPRISALALSMAAAELPEVSLGDIGDPTGRNTDDAMNAGILWSAVFTADGYISALGAQNVVITGGSAPLILPRLSHKADYRPALCLEGLWRIWSLVCEKKRRGKA